jgi:hypothetical protein
MESHAHRFRRLSAIALGLGYIPKGHRTVNQVAGITKMGKMQSSQGVKFQLCTGDGKTDYLYIETKQSAFLPVAKVKTRNLSETKNV